MVFDRILRAGEGRTLKKLKVLADQVNSIEDEFVNLSDAELRAMTDELRQRYTDGETLEDLLPEAFATVREAAKRTIQQRHYDVQLMGGAALHTGNIAEMKTGEGKTLTSSLPAYLNALSGKGVHIVTVNDYLARRDAEWGARVHGFLGLTVGVISPQMTPAERRASYACDITYGTNAEFGFDYLRDNMAWSNEELVQRGHHFAIVDEVDSILIDEARTPLIISGPADQPTRWYQEFARVVSRLTPEVDYEVDEGKRTVGITDDGIAKVEDQLGIENLYESANTPLVGYLNNAIKAKELYKKDKDYIVVQGEVLIVDEFTGRVLAGRRYSEGMHQAIEAKENVEIKQENQTLATITLQNFFRLYDKLSGMTGTAMTEAAEFDQIYKLGVVQIPTNRDMVRKDLNDVIYKTEVAKFDAVVEDVAERHGNGQPILIGTTSVSKSEYLSGLLLKRGIAHTVLNAKQHDREAHTIAEAGRKGAVTVSTNMAGRGTDIMLGGNPEFLATEALHAQGLSPLEDAEAYEAAWPAALSKAKAEVELEHEQVVSLGGLFVLGTERHESRRIDNQLRGRSGRQGDPGESKFYLSLGDDLMRMFNGAMVESIMNRLNIPDDVPIETKIVSNSIRSAQTQVEGQNFEIRKNVLKYDEVMNKQRHVIYDDRRRVLDGADLEDQVRHMIDDTVAAYVTGATGEGFPEDWDLKQLWTGLGALYPISTSYEQIDAMRESLDADELLERLQEDAQSAYDRRTEQVGEEAMRELERRVVLSVLDRKWREHLYEMDYLQEGIGLRAMGQRDPLVEYQREGFDMFMAMQDAIKEESFGFLFNVEVVTEEEPDGVSEPTVELAVASSSDPALAVEPGVEPRPETPLESSAPFDPAPVTQPADAPPPAAPVAPPVYQAAPVAPAAPAAPAAARTILPDLTPSRPANLQYTAPSEDGSAITSSTGGAQDGGSGPSRNGPCPCGSGRKYKRCHGGANAG